MTNPTPTPPTCASCRFWNDMRWHPQDRYRGQCRVDLPAPPEAPRSKWPLTEFRYGCDRFKPRGEHQPREDGR